MAQIHQTQRPPRYDPSVLRPDPHAAFARIRAQAPVVDLGADMPMVLRYRDVEALLKHADVGQAAAKPLESRQVRAGAMHDFYRHSMLVSDPPDHPRLRRPAARTFAHRAIQAWRPRIRAIVSELLDEAVRDDRVDFVRTVAAPLPARLVADLLGAPEDAPRFAQMVYAMARGLGPFRAEVFPAVEAAAQALTAYVKGLVEARRRAPGDDFLSDFLARASEDDALSEIEILIQIVTVILAGSDTTRFGLTMLVSQLLKHPDQWAALSADPSLAPAAVLEAVRCEPPVGSTARVLKRDLEVAGMRFPAGAALALSIISAQRDEAIYAEPQRFDIHRSDHPQWSLSFGLGPHRCLGEALARAEMEEAIAILATRLPNLSVVGAHPAPLGVAGVRGVSSMIVRFQERARYRRSRPRPHGAGSGAEE